MLVHVIRADGRELDVESARNGISKLIGATVMDGFSLRDGRYVFADDEGHRKKLPVNAKATALYHGICKPGTLWQILGDVAIISDDDA